MLTALIVTLREGVEAALIVGIIFAYLGKIGRSDLRKTVYAALVVGLLGSVSGAVVLARLKVNSDAYDGWVMLLAAFFVISMLIFMMRTAHLLKGKIESRLGALAGAGSKLGLFVFVVLLVLREGIETVLILSGVTLNSTELMSFLGTLIGVGLALVFGVMFVKGSVRISLQKFFRITSIILSFVALQLIVSGLHELSEAGVLPSSQREMALVGPIVRNEAFFFVTILSLAGLMVLLEYGRKKPEPSAIASEAQVRKNRWTARRERLWAGLVCTTSFIFIVMITAEFVFSKVEGAAAVSSATALELVNGQVSIPKSVAADGELHRYSIDLRGTTVRFLLYRKPDGEVAIVFDACEICGSSGFYRTANGLSCRNCSAPVNTQSLGQRGGCNPVPLKSTVVGGTILIAAADLETGVPEFQRE
jgi:high-affinity iron transporter